MKLRIRGQSIRLRLTQNEVRQLAETQRVEERVVFGAGPSLEYAIELATDVPAIEASFGATRLVVRVPLAMAMGWATDETVGMEAEQATAEGSLRILIEKDFACLKPRDEDETDMFPHPRADGTC